jgi:tRNA A37 methylthiotransferase MiaB
MANQVDRSVIIGRARKLQALASEKKQNFLKQWKGTTVKVLLESRNRRGWMGGLTSEYVRVEVLYDETLVNQLVDVQIELIGNGFVRGKVI